MLLHYKMSLCNFYDYCVRYTLFFLYLTRSVLSTTMVLPAQCELASGETGP